MSRLTGRALNSEWGIGAYHTLYREDGKWYHVLKKFPGALCDANGFVRFDTEDDYRSCHGVHVTVETNSCHVPEGISSLSSYVRVK